jgi:membrane associated rhomboid family serine protease
MRFSDKMERRFGWIAVPHVLGILAALQVLVFILMRMRGDEDGSSFLNLLTLDSSKILRGEVWRLISYIFIPAQNLFYLIIGAMVLMVSGSALEAEWGSFRLTSYVLLTALGISLGAVLTSLTGIGAPQSFRELLASTSLESSFGSIVFGALISMILGLVCPKLVWRLYGIIPVKSSILAWLAFGGLVLLLVRAPLSRLPIATGSIPFLFVALPRFYLWYVLKERVWQNRPKFNAALAQNQEHFSKCTTCGRTDATNPELVFRVAGDGEEYCQEHLPMA